MFNDWLLSKLKEKEWSQADLSRASGLTTAAISKYINGRTPDTDALKKIAHAFRLPNEQVFEAAGILPPKIELSPARRKLLYISEDLPDSDVELATSLLEQRKEFYKKNPQSKPSK